MLNRNKVLRVKRSLQGHPQSGVMWEQHIGKILSSPELVFKSPTHDKCIYRGNYKGKTVLLLRQVDDFNLSCDNEETAKAIFEFIGKQLQLPAEKSIPFKYIGKASDYNGIDIDERREYVELNCHNYIDRMLISHGWNKPAVHENSKRPGSPIPDDVISTIYTESKLGPQEGSSQHQKLEDEMGFSYRTLLGELMFCYVTCRPDIGYAVCTLSKFSSSPGKLHYKHL